MSKVGNGGRLVCRESAGVSLVVLEGDWVNSAEII